MRLRIAVSIALLIVRCAVAPAAEERLPAVDVFVSGQGGYHTYRIPALLRAADGTLLAFCEGRKTSRGDHGDIDLLLRRSSDGGATWSPSEVVYEEGGDKKVTIGNPCPVLDSATCTIWLTFCRDNRDVLVTSSSDHGRTWTAPRDITADVKPAGWSWYATGPGVGIQLSRGAHRGRLVIPCDHREQVGDKGVKCSHVFYSDDHGQTWKLGGTVAHHTDECQVAELADGELLINMRNYLARDGGQPERGLMRTVARSRDGGQTWADFDVDRALVEPVCQASLIAAPAADDASKVVLYFANPATRDKRQNMTVRASYDGGRTWPVVRVVDPGSAAYSSLAVLADGSVGLVYERDDYRAISFVALPRDLAATTPAGDRANGSGDEWTTRHIGFTEFRTNLPSRHANCVTMRAVIARADGSDRREVAPELVNKPDMWSQFAGWSPDGTQAIVGAGWESPENARWEEEHKTFRFTPEGWLYDAHLVDLASGRAFNATAVERVSFYNSGLFFWPGDPDRLGFTALIEGNSHPFSMRLDGRDKRDLTADSREFAYGFSASPDGRRIAYHKSYQVYIADADGSNVTHVTTGQPFNFVPQWSSDGAHLMFVAGEHYNCHPHVVRADGTGLRKLADRRGYRGVVEFLDVPDFHGGSSDVPQWAPDGRSIYFTAAVDDGVALFRMALDGQPQQLAECRPGWLFYHPQPSADGRWLVYGSRRDGLRQLYVMRLADQVEKQLTYVATGHGAMWAHWQPVK
ncbi:MAG: exo-alpha-sialidase [Pirellulales bacterium]|nr:exo-alpha-sialidase [Pirellulales bacterium]